MMEYKWHLCIWEGRLSIIKYLLIKKNSSSNTPVYGQCSVGVTDNLWIFSSRHMIPEDPLLFSCISGSGRCVRASNIWSGRVKWYITLHFHRCLEKRMRSERNRDDIYHIIEPWNVHLHSKCQKKKKIK